VTIHAPLAPGVDGGVLTVTDPADIARIAEPGVGGLVWQRRPLASFRQWIDALPPAQLPRARMILRPDAVRPAVVAACDTAGTPHGAERDRLADDIAALADIFAGALSARWLRLRLDVVDTNACRRFHVDRVIARLVCTCRGTGTQYGVSTGRTPRWSTPFPPDRPSSCAARSGRRSPIRGCCTARRPSRARARRG